MQLIMLGHCLQVYREQPIEAPAQDFTAILKTNCCDWVLNDSKGPMAEILRLRLLAIHIAGETVRQAQIRWKDDGQNLIFKDIQFGLRPLQAWIREVLREANEIMEECLCLGLDDIPILKPHDWRDNWEESRPGRSFIDDPRNQSRHEGQAQWLYRQILERPPIRQRFFKQDTNGGLILVPLAADEYEKDVQRFLERLMVLLHVSSGQPGRRPEFIGRSDGGSLLGLPILYISYIQICQPQELRAIFG